jgi:hypothetical protein
MSRGERINSFVVLFRQSPLGCDGVSESVTEFQNEPRQPKLSNLSQAML